MHLAAQQVIDRLSRGLAGDVPAGHLDAGEDAAERHVRALAVAPAVDAPPQPLDAEGIGADDMALHHIGDHARDEMRSEGRGIDLAHPLDAVIGDELQEDEIAPAEARRRIADDEGPEVLDLHAAPRMNPAEDGTVRRKKRSMHICGRGPMLSSPPDEAGIPSSSRRKPGSRVARARWLPWTPAFAGVTEEKMGADNPHAIALPRRGGGGRGSASERERA